jgi:hypothetical protein
MASVALSRRVEKVVGYAPLSEMGDDQRREFHEALLDADSFEDLPGKWQAAFARRRRIRRSYGSLAAYPDEFEPLEAVGGRDERPVGASEQGRSGLGPLQAQGPGCSTAVRAEADHKAVVSG